MAVWTDVWVFRWMFGRMFGCLDGCLGVWMVVWACKFDAQNNLMQVSCTRIFFRYEFNK
jgi:hypothetical protein